MATSPAAKTAKAEKAATRAYPVLSRLEHDGEVYAPGTPDDTVELTDAQAAPLLELKVVGKPAAA